MKKKNRKKRQMDGFAFPSKLVGLVVIGVVLALIYTWMDFCIECVGNDIKKLEKQHEALVKRRTIEMSKWSSEKSPENLMRVLKEHGIRMSWPARNQIVHLSCGSLHASHVAELNVNLVEPPRIGEVVMND